jgi:hypothetical protein
MRIAVTSLSRAREPGQLLYALETDEVGGLFSVDVQSGEEKRLFHGNSTRVLHPSARPEVELIACSVPHEGGTANLAVLRADGSDMLEVTEGDSLDLAPVWIPGKPQLLYQSAGLGRDRSGNFEGYGPFALNTIDLKTGAITPLVEDAGFDHLCPRVGADGTVWTIRRPWHVEAAPSFWRSLLDVVLFPWRLLLALFGFLNFFSLSYTGKPLSQGGTARQKAADMKRMMVWGNLIDADKEARKSRARGDEAPALVPQSWQLVKIVPPSVVPQVVARGVLAFDLADDGSVLWSNRSAIFRIALDGASQTLHKDEQIEQVVALG